MNTIDERLHHAADQVRLAVAQVPSRGSQPVSRAAGTMRRIVQGAVAIALLVATVGGGTMLLNGGNEVASGAAEFPRLTLDTAVAGGELTLIFADDSVVSSQPAVPDNLQVFGDPLGDYSSGRIFVVTDADGSDFFRGEAYNDPGWTPVAVPVGAAFLHVDGLTSTVLWQVGSEEGPVISVQGLGIDTQALLGVLGSIQHSGGKTEVQSLPANFTELYSGPVRVEGEREVMLVWAAPNSDAVQTEITLQLLERADAPMERGLYSGAYQGIGAFSDAVVVGRPALRMEMSGVSDGGVVIFQWLQTPQVFARLIIQGSLDPDEVAAALHEVDSSTWERLFRGEDDSAEAVVTTTMPIPSQLEPGGVELQNEILADGNVSREEFTRAIAGNAECMTTHGVTGVTWSVDDDGIGWSMEYDSPSADTHRTTESLCYYSYVDRVLDALVESQR